MVLKLASFILRGRRLSPRNPAYAFLARWAAQQLGAKGRAIAAQNRRRARAFRWADRYTSLLELGYTPAQATVRAERW